MTHIEIGKYNQLWNDHLKIIKKRQSSKSTEKIKFNNKIIK